MAAQNSGLSAEEYRKLLEEFFAKRNYFSNSMLGDEGTYRRDRYDSGAYWRQLGALGEEADEIRDKLQELNEQRKKATDEDQIKKIDLAIESVSNRLDAINKETQKITDETSGALGKITGTINGMANIGNNVKNSIKGMYDSVAGFADSWKKADAAASSYAKTVGTTAAGMEALRKSTINNVAKNHIGIDFNIGTEELLKLQENYSKNIGRNIKIDNGGQANMAAMAAMGQDAGEWGAAFDTFGVSINGVAKDVGKMFSNAAKEGISFDKVASNVKSNIKIAQNYTFKDGLKGLESMAKKSAAIKLDMQVASTLAGKVNSVEGAIDVASRLQVLGGPFANFADPMGMLNEGLNDMEGLQDRIASMIGGLGTFNKQTGEVEVSAFNKRRVAEAANAMGVSQEQLMESVNAQARRGEVENQIKASKTASSLDTKMQELIKNTATFDENGKAGVSINGEFKSLDELSNKDYEELVKETQSESDDIKDIAKNLRSLVDIEQGVGKQQEAVRARSAERMKTGDHLKKAANRLGQTNVALWALNGLLAAQALGGFIGNFKGLIGGKGLNISRFFGGGGGKTGGVSNMIGNRMNPFKGGGFGGITKAMSQQKGVIGKVGKGLRNARAATLKAGRSVSSATAKMTAKASTKVLGKSAQTISKGASQVATKVAAKKAAATTAAKAIGKKVAASAAGKFAAGALSSGGLVGILGAAGDIATDALVAKGKIKKGGKAHAAMKGGSKALEGAGIGLAVGGGLAALGATGIGAPLAIALGAIMGGRAIAKVRREKELDERLKAKGIEKQGDYSPEKLKKINNALEKGKMSNRLKKKLIKEGDMAIVNEIEAKKKEKDEEKEQKKAAREEKKNKRREQLAKFMGAVGPSKLKTATFHVGVANFHGGFGRGGDGKSLGQKVIGGIKKGKDLATAIFGKPEEGKGEAIKAALRGDGEEMSVYEKAKLRNSSGEGKDFNINLNGTLKLEGKDGQSIDIISELKNNPIMLRNLADMIAKEMGYLEHGTYVTQQGNK